MSLTLKFSICESSDCKSFVFTELTGLYNVTTNITGWGSPNPETTDAVSATLKITRGDGQIFNIDMKNLYSYPSSDTTYSTIIPQTSFGYSSSQKIPDQIMTLQYIIEINNGEDPVYTVSQTIYQTFNCQIKCCILSMPLKIDWSCQSCSSDSVDDFLQAYALYHSMLANGRIGNITQYNNELNQLQKICNGAGCKNCAN